MTRLAECSDEDLVAMLQRRELGAIEELYDRHHRLALALAYRVVGDRESAEDVVQETFLAAWRQASTYQPERGRARAWLLSIARHRAIDRIRRSRGAGDVAELDESMVDERAPDAFQLTDQNFRRERMRSALATLPSEQREVVEMAFYGGLTHTEIADQIGAPLGTVKGRLRLAMDKLRSTLADLRQEIGGTA